MNPTSNPAAAFPSGVYPFEQVLAEKTPVGQRRAFFTAATATLDALAVHMTTLDPGQAPHPPHQHPDEEMILIREGTMEITINGKLQQAGSGSVVFVAPNDLHGWKNAGSTPANYFVLRWSTAKTAAE